MTLPMVLPGVLPGLLIQRLLIQRLLIPDYVDGNYYLERLLAV